MTVKTLFLSAAAREAMGLVRGEHLGWRVCLPDMTSRNGFVWKMGENIAPDWNARPRCGGGLHVFGLTDEEAVCTDALETAVDSLCKLHQPTLSDVARDDYDPVPLFNWLWVAFLPNEGVELEGGVHQDFKFKVPRCRVLFVGTHRQWVDRATAAGIEVPYELESFEKNFSVKTPSHRSPATGWFQNVHSYRTWFDESGIALAGGHSRAKSMHLAIACDHHSLAESFGVSVVLGHTSKAVSSSGTSVACVPSTMAEADGGVAVAQATRAILKGRRNGDVLVFLRDHRPPLVAVVGKNWIKKHTWYRLNDKQTRVVMAKL